MGSGFSKKKKQAKMLEQQFAQMREEMQKTEVSASSANDLVTVTLNGEKELKKIVIKPECVDPDDIEGLQDLIIDAMQNASKKLDENQPSSPTNFPF